MGRPPKLDKLPTLREYEDTVRRLRYEAMRKPDLDKVLPLTVLVTGARISEILMITTMDIDFDNMVIAIPTLKRKDKGKRILPVTSWYANILQMYIVRNAITDKLFPISRPQAWRIVKKETGWNPHAWRHVVGMYLLYRGYDVEYVRRWLGHSSWDVVKYYVQVVQTHPYERRHPLEDV